MNLVRDLRLGLGAFPHEDGVLAGGVEWWGGVRVEIWKSGGKKKRGGELYLPGVGGGEESFSWRVGVEVITGTGVR